MPISEDKNRLYVDKNSGKGISLDDVAECLKDYRVTKFGRDVGVLCTSPNINKFAKYKPIRYNTWGVLTKDQYKGMSTDAADGIYYGIKINGPINAEIGPNLVDIHDTEFEYIRPTGGAESPFRVLDFDGYNHNAQPNPAASFQRESLEAYYDDDNWSDGSLGGIMVRYYENNEDGVDFTSFLNLAGNESPTNLLKTLYPCILVTDDNGKSYFTALDYNAGDSNQPTARPLYYNNAYIGGPNWSVRFGKPRYQTPSEGTSSKPWNDIMNGRATLFLVESWDITGPYLDAMHQINFSENWIPIADNMAIKGKPIVLPAPKLGVPITLSGYKESSVYFVPLGVIYSNDSFSINLNKVGESASLLSVTCTVDVNGATATQTKSTPGNTSRLPGFIFTAASLGMAAFMPNTTYTVRVTIKTQEGSKSTTKTGTYTFTA